MGSAIFRRLTAAGYDNIVTRSHAELDLAEQKAVRDFFRQEGIDQVVLAAAKVGGIHANNAYPADFIYQNLMIEANVIQEAYRAGVANLLFLGSSCIYPKFAPQPMREEHLLTGILEPTNEPYAIAKIAGIKMCEAYNRQHGVNYYSLMPTNLYGPGDNYHLENSHVIPAMLRKFHLARLAMQGDLAAIRRDEATWGDIPFEVKKVIGLAPDSSRLTPESRAAKVLLWGTGKARREFLHVDDLAAACVFVLRMGALPADLGVSFLNVGTGIDCTIAEVAEQIRSVTGFAGEVVYDTSKPDGTPQKLLDVARINSLGWRPEVALVDGLRDAYGGYLEECDGHRLD